MPWDSCPSGGLCFSTQDYNESCRKALADVKPNKEEADEEEEVQDVKPMRIIQCTRCHKKHFEDGFRVNRLRQRLKTCLECNARVVHGGSKEPCPHGIKNRSQCRHCEPVRYRNMITLRDFRRVQKLPMWPEPHVTDSTRSYYDAMVKKWSAVWDELLAANRITQDEYNVVMAKMAPFVGKE